MFSLGHPTPLAGNLSKLAAGGGSTATRWLLGLLLLLAVSGCSMTPWGRYQARRERMEAIRDKAFAEIAPAAQRMDRIDYLVAEKAKGAPAETDRAATELIELLQTEKDVLVRIRAVQALGEWSESPAVLTALEGALTDSNAEVRVAACEAWRTYRGTAGIDVLGQVVVNDESSDVRLAALRELGKLKDAKAVAAIAPALDSRDPALQYRAVQSMKAVSSENLGDDVAAWREYAQSGTVQRDVPTIAQRLRRLF